MLIEAGQALTEAAKQTGVINIAIPTALVSSTLALLGREGIAWVVGKRRGKNGNGVKPGMGEECVKRGERMAVIETKTAGLKEDILRVEGKVDLLLERK